jgi:hypothetical protein
MGMQKREYPHTGRNPKVRGEGESGSRVITIPMGVADRLDLDPGERPSEIYFDDDGRSVRFEFDE